MTVTDLTRVIVTRGETSSTACVHHRDFPEIRADGETPAVAAEHLINHLVRALDSALTDWRRGGIQQAIQDVKAYVAQSEQAH